VKYSQKIKFSEYSVTRTFFVASSYIPFITKYRKASRVQRTSRYYKTLRRSTRTTFRGWCGSKTA